MIEEYFQSLLDLLSASPIVRATNINFEIRSTAVGFVRGEIDFTNGSRLHLRELLDLRSSPVQVMYAYHYQDADGVLIFRYDSTRHFPDLPGFPFHKHLPQGDVMSSPPKNLAEVLQEIESGIDTINPASPP